MTLPPVSPELAARLANYNIDDRARAVLQELAPVLEPHLGAALDEVIAGAARLQQVAELYKKHSGEFRRIEIGPIPRASPGGLRPALFELLPQHNISIGRLGFEGRSAEFRAAVLRKPLGVCGQRPLVSRASCG
jgi:hypothetical protein